MAGASGSQQNKARPSHNPLMQASDITRRGKLAGKWVWLFPLTYLAHIAEEYWVGEGFPAWVSRVAGVELTPTQFLSLNGIAWVLMVAGSILALQSASMRWLVISFGTVVLLNGLFHLIASFVTVSYSPGLFTGLLLWVPLGAFTLLRSWTSTKRRMFLLSMFVGIGIHAIVSLLVFYTGKVMS